jgi:hypothetical protein
MSFPYTSVPAIFEISERKCLGPARSDAGIAAASSARQKFLQPTMMEEVEITEVPPPVEPLKDLEDEDDIEDEDTKKKRERERSFWTKVWQGLAAASLATNIAAMVLVGSGVSIAMGVIACVVAPIVIKRQMDLQDTESE